MMRILIIQENDRLTKYDAYSNALVLRMVGHNYEIVITPVKKELIGCSIDKGSAVALISAALSWWEEMINENDEAI